MATKSQRYDHPTYTINREHCVGECGGTATTVFGKFHKYVPFKLKAVHVRVTTAGTATTHKFDVYIGTTSVASAALSTSTAGVTTSVAVGSNVTSLQAVEVKTGADADGLAVISYEYEDIPGSDMTK